MKTHLLLLLTLGVFASQLRAAVIVQFSSDSAPADQTQIVSPDYVAGHSLDASGLSPSDDSLERLAGSLTYRGWSSGIDLDKYVGFSISARPGYELDLTHLSFETLSSGGSHVSSTAGVSSYVWAYRIDEGDGYSAWVFGQMYSASNPAGVTQTWDFDDVHTTGTVEFGLFATSNAASGGLSLGMVSIDGVVPEASTGALGGISCLLLLRRRRARR